MNFVTATVYNPKLLSMDFQDASSSMRSVIFADDVSTMNISVMKTSSAKYFFLFSRSDFSYYSVLCINSEAICNIFNHIIIQKDNLDAPFISVLAPQGER